MPKKKIALIPGDGIGPEVIAAAQPVIAAAAEAHGMVLDFVSLPYSADHYLATGETLPDHAFEMLRDDTDAILLGALGDPRVPANEHARDILLGLRFKLDLFINFRPTKLLHPRFCRVTEVDDIDFVIFRENTEGQYTGRGKASHEGTEEEVQVAEEVHSYRGVRRIIQAAFDWAHQKGRSRVTMSDKSNAIAYQRIWGRLFAEVGSLFPDVEREHRYVDVLAMELVQDPGRFQVIVTNNLYGDILSDLGAGLVGGLGLAASANLHPGRPGLFEPVHGSAPPLAGKGVANPVAALLTGSLMLDQLGCPAGSAALAGAVSAVLADGPTTPDLGGSASTSEVARAVADALVP